MLKFISGAIGALIFAGLALALLVTFDWSVTAIITWAWNSCAALLAMIADWFMSAEWFQKLVRG